MTTPDSPRPSADAAPTTQWNTPAGTGGMGAPTYNMQPPHPDYWSAAAVQGAPNAAMADARARRSAAPVIIGMLILAIIVVLGITVALGINAWRPKAPEPTALPAPTSSTVTSTSTSHSAPPPAPQSEKPPAPATSTTASSTSTPAPAYPAQFTGTGWSVNGESKARCGQGTTAIFAGRNAESFVTICQGADGAMTYHGFVNGGSLDWGVDPHRSLPATGNYVVNTGDATINVSPTLLSVFIGGELAMQQPLTEHWAAR